MKKVLLICTVPALESYNVGIITTALQSKVIDYYAYIFLDGNEHRSIDELRYLYGISDEKKSKVIFHRLASGKAVRILSSADYLNQVAVCARRQHICKLHFISQDVMLHGHLDRFEDFELFYTVHDLIPHPAKLNALQRLKHYYFRIRKDKQLIRFIDNLVTNSVFQKEILERLYPEKSIFLHTMPSLVTPAIESGKTIPVELKDNKDYILFFGKIESYKGVEVLYNTFVNHPEFKNRKLVIAGKGVVYFERNKGKEANIVFINRYVADEEIAYLFTHSSMLILPYHSATQSAVASIAYHYHIPVVASDIDGLRESVIHGSTGLLYSPDAADALPNAILRLSSDHQLKRKISNFLKTENPLFNQKQLSTELSTIY